MPRIPIDYSKSLVYKIVCNDLNITDIYVGSTTDFRRRKSQHKYCCYNKDSLKYNFPIYMFIRANGGWNNWTMVEIEKFPCNDGNELRARERYWFELLEAKLNKVVPNRPVKEYQKQHSAQYRKKNKEQIAAHKSEKFNCACGGKYTKSHEARHFLTKKHIQYCF